MRVEHSFGSWLKLRRNAVGITQDALSAQLGFSPALLRKLESGERRPSGQIAALVAEYFRVPADERVAFVAFARNAAADLLAPAGAHDEATAHAPWRSRYGRLTNLPARLTTLIGRAGEVHTVRERLLHPDCRLLTLVGPPGIGKTRLGLQVAATMLAAFDDGVFFVDLSALDDAALVLPTVARALGLTADDGRPRARVLTAYAYARRMLLVLDNFEHVMDAAPVLVTLLEASPWIKVLVTSREPLHVGGERRFAVPPLALPDPGRLLPPEAAAAYPAVALFVERAQAVAPDFVVTEANVGDVVAICAGLEGMPLALELAAARAGHMSPHELRSALHSRLTLLTGGGPELPARHRTLRSAIAWSYDLLHPVAQQLFRHLGVFAHGATAAAVETVWPNDPAADAPPADLLRSLVDQQVVRAEHQPAPARARRYSLLEAVREYAIEQLEQHSELEPARRRHAEYYLSLAERAEQQFWGAKGRDWGASGRAWSDTLEAELDNMRAALDWFAAHAAIEAAAPSDPGTGTFTSIEQGLRLATALRRVWVARGHGLEGRERLLRLVAAVPAPLPATSPRLRAAYAAAIGVLGRLALLHGDAAAVRPLLEYSLQIVREQQDAPRIALTLLNLGAVAAAQGDYVAANVYQLDCLQQYEALDDTWGAAAVLEDMGDLQLKVGSSAQAQSLLEASLVRYHAVDEQFGAASVLASLGRLAYGENDYATARAWWEQSLALRTEIEYRSKLGDSFAQLGWVALHEGKHAEASSRWNRGLMLACEHGAVDAIHRCLVGLAALATAGRQHERAARLLGAAAVLRTEHVMQLAAAEEADLASTLAAARSHLADTWSTACATGSAMTIEEAIQYALGQGAVSGRGAASR